VTFNTGEPSYCEEIDDFLLLELGVFTKLPTGFRIIGLKEQEKRLHSRIMRQKVQDAVKIQLQKHKKRATSRIENEILDRQKKLRKVFREIKKEQLIEA